MSEVQDQIGCPTDAEDLAVLILDIINTVEWQSGIYYYDNEGIISWFEFATAIKKLAERKCELFGITSDSYPMPAKRPVYSLVNTS